jgi:hypothetical protein
MEEFAQKVPILSLEVNGETVELLGLPLQALGMTPAQQREFEKAGGLMNPTPQVAKKAPLKWDFVKKYDYALVESQMMYWVGSFENFQEEIDGKLYKGFGLFKKVYEAFPDIRSMTKDEATEAGLYPTIHYRNFGTLKLMAEMSGGYLPNLDTE